jgi:hypothetical protein
LLPLAQSIPLKIFSLPFFINEKTIIKSALCFSQARFL